MPPRRRVLVALVVYNGRSFVPRALASAARLQGSGHHDVDVLILDDASPEAGFSDEMALLSNSLGIGYYRSPRNLGIPRNFNLGLLRAEQGDYDHVAIVNSDVILPFNLVDSLVAVAEAPSSTGPIASVTAWSNNASIFSLPNDDADSHLADEPTVDWLSSRLAAEFGAESVAVPVGMGFCFLVPRGAIDAVGLFDPVFGRGYCEEVDWCRRAVERGWVNVLAPSAFVYHMGSASSRPAGLLEPGQQTVHLHEQIVDRRHPGYRDETVAWEATGAMAGAVQRGIRTIVTAAARGRGYVVEATWLQRRQESAVGSTVERDDRVRVVVNPDGPAPLVEAVTQGWHCPIEVAAGASGAILAGIAAFVGCRPDEVRIFDRGDQAAALAAEAARSGVAVTNLARYPGPI